MSNDEEQNSADFTTSTYASPDAQPGSNWELVWERYWAKSESKNGKKVGMAFIEKSAIRKYSTLYFIANDGSGQFKLRADLSGASDENVGTLTLTTNEYVGVPTNINLIQRAQSLFPAGYCTGLTFTVWGAP